MGRNVVDVLDVGDPDYRSAIVLSVLYTAELAPKQLN
jgi:hypothetical protein